MPPSFCKTATVPKQEVYKSIKTIKARAWAGFMEFLMQTLVENVPPPPQRLLALGLKH